MNIERIGKFIAELRKAKGMTQSELAEKLNISDKAISKWENGKGIPDTLTIPILAKLFGVTADEIFAGERNNRIEDSVESAVVAATENRDDKYLFLDTEGDVDVKSGFKTCGFAVTDEKFGIVESRDVDFRMIEPNGSEIKSEQPFNRLYCILRDNLPRASRVIGFAVQYDVDRINKACERFKTPPLTFKYFDVLQLFKRLFPGVKNPSLKDCVRILGIKERFTFHNSQSDATATVRVMQKLCAKEKLTIPQCIERYPDCTGFTENYKSHHFMEKGEDTLESSNVAHFKIRVDFPLICFKKKAGAVRDDGFRDGKCFYYDPVLDELFEDRHPHKAAKDRGNSLPDKFFFQAQNRGTKKLKTEQQKFFEYEGKLVVSRYIVSYECVGVIGGDTFTLSYGEKYLKELGRTNPYVKMLMRRGIDAQNVILKYYDADAFVNAIFKNAKWRYGDKTREMELPDSVRIAAAKDAFDSELFLPRVYENILTGKLGENAVIACKKEHMGYAVARDEVIDIDTLGVDDSVALVVKTSAGEVYELVPCTKTVNCPMYKTKYTVPLIMMRKTTEVFA